MDSVRNKVQNKTKTASNSAGQPTNEPVTPTTPPSVLRQQVKKLEEKLEEAKKEIKRLTSRLEEKEDIQRCLLRYLNTQHIKKRSAHAQFKKLRFINTSDLSLFLFCNNSTGQMKEIEELGILFSLYFSFNILQIQWLNIFLEIRSGFVEKE